MGVLTNGAVRHSPEVRYIYLTYCVMPQPVGVGSLVLPAPASYQCSAWEASSFNGFDGDNDKPGHTRQS